MIMMEGENPIINRLKGGLKRPSWVFLLMLVTFIAILSLQMTTKLTGFPLWTGPGPEPEMRIGFSGGGDRPTCVGFFRAEAARKVVKSIREFGGVGDGKTSNTASFRRAMVYMEKWGKRGGAQLNVPKGKWVTGSFNLTSNFTLFLEQGAVILASQDAKEWPIIEALPSYGRGRERLGGRHISLLHGNSLTNVVITGQNGTIDGQGKIWWDLWWNKTLEYTRGHLVELINSQNILISNLTFRNSPFWTVHPVYCSNVVIKDMTILAPLNAPNTDGIDVDSSTNVCVEDCYIESGDDLVAVKSGWDQYGIAMARPSSDIIIRRVSGTTPTCSGIGIGSEMSGGISNVMVEDLYVRDSAAGIRIKTDKGRGGYIANITISNVKMERVKVPIRFSRDANDHPDEGWDPKAIPKVKGIYVINVVSLESIKAPLLEGIEDAPFEEICMRNVSILGLPPSLRWTCKYVSGFSEGVAPFPCPELRSNSSSSTCLYSI